MINTEAKPLMKEIFENVVNWLKFAEAKNAALLATNGTLTVILAGRTMDILNLNYYIFFFYFLPGIVFLILSSFVAIFSFFPKIIEFHDLPEDYVDNSRKRNLTFYGDIAHYNSREHYVKDIYKRYFDMDNITPSTLELDYAEGIIINSKIALGKYKYFRIASMLSLAAFATPYVMFIYFIFYQIDKRLKK